MCLCAGPEGQAKQVQATHARCGARFHPAEQPDTDHGEEDRGAQTAFSGELGRGCASACL